MVYFEGKIVNRTTSNIMLIYPEGGSNIRTICRAEEVLFSLTDVINLLAQQNSQLAAGGRSGGLMGLIKAQLEVLEDDEKENVKQENSTVTETYVTQPGLFRIILRDNSPACKRFQRWVIHEVLPSVQKYGTYPPPIVSQESDLKRVVQSLLSEIENRERLEKETKLKFIEHEDRLNQLASRLDTVQPSASYMTVQKFCDMRSIDKSHSQMIRGWCLKICFEENEPSTTMSEGMEELPAFPEHVLVKAAQKVCK
jgi:prophage antirepressor-like protein